MQNKKNPPTKAQSDFWDELVAIGCIIEGEGMPSEIHHIAGGSCKHKKEKIGHWFVLAIGSGPHQHNKPNLTSSRTQFCDLYREGWGVDWSDLDIEKRLFIMQCDRYAKIYGRPVPIPDSAMGAIMDYGGKGGRVSVYC